MTLDDALGRIAVELMINNTREMHQYRNADTISAAEIDAWAHVAGNFRDMLIALEAIGLIKFDREQGSTQ